MEKDKKDMPAENEVQEGKEIKKDAPVKNKMTDSVKNTASQTPGLNQERTTRDDIFPSDGDNLTK